MPIACPVVQARDATTPGPKWSHDHPMTCQCTPSSPATRDATKAITHASA